MNLERIYTIALLAISLLASIPQIPVDIYYWAIILVVLGVAGGVMVNYEDLVQRILVYVLATSLPAFSNSLNFIPVVGKWANTYFDNMAIGIQGMAAGLLVMGLYKRVKG